MSEREMLERAAAAAGLYYWSDGDALLTHGDGPGSTREWNPLTDDGDALRLAVRLRIHITMNAFGAAASGPSCGEVCRIGKDAADVFAATRLAITRAAAALAPASPDAVTQERS